VWRFELRKGVQFHDGTPFTADDVVFSWRARRGL
jgi:peptide/nickel transport system substrate-binding protein